MYEHDILRRAAELSERGEPFALATVVGRTPPSSARVGGKALVRSDGTLEGWLGGSCIEPVVRREARAALRERRSRYVILTPDGEADRPGAYVHPMTCHSGGTVEIFVEPQLPVPALTLFGDSPVNRALCRLGPVAGLRVEVVGAEDPGAFPEARTLEDLDAAGGGDGGGGTGVERYAVVATMGDWDEDAVRQALDAGARYVGLVASPARAEEVRRRVEGGGTTWDERVRSPAGLDLGAEEPGEIAVTILAEVIAARRAGRTAEGTPEAGDEPAPAAASDAAGEGGAGETAGGDLAVDPVCGMEVDVAEGGHVYVHRGVTYHFCCAGCRETFAEDPESWIETVEDG